MVLSRFPDTSSVDFVKSSVAVSAGGLAAEEPGECSQRGSMWSHPYAEETATEHAELHACSAPKRPLETTWPAGKQRATPALFSAGFPSRSLESLTDSMTRCSLRMSVFEIQQGSKKLNYDPILFYYKGPHCTLTHF